MYNIKFWNSIHLHIGKIIFTLLVFVANNAQGQGTNMLEHDDNRYYFGIIAGPNNAQFRVFHSDFFTQSDSVQAANPRWNIGLNAGITGNLRLTQHTGLRLAPQFVFATKSIDYDMKYKRDTTVVIESILMHLPLSFKFSSDRISNFRFFVLGGAKYDYDFNSNVRSRRDDEVIKIKPQDFGYDLGFGFDFYYPNYILSPEIKISNGFGNVQKRDDAVLTSKIFDQLNSRMIFLSVTIGG